MSFNVRPRVLSRRSFDVSDTLPLQPPARQKRLSLRSNVAIAIPRKDRSRAWRHPDAMINRAGQIDDVTPRKVFNLYKGLKWDNFKFRFDKAIDDEVQLIDSSPYPENVNKLEKQISKLRQCFGRLKLRYNNDEGLFLRTESLGEFSNFNELDTFLLAEQKVAGLIECDSIDTAVLTIHFLQHFPNQATAASEIAVLFDRLSPDSQCEVLHSLREMIEASPVHGKAFDDLHLKNSDREEFVIYHHRKLTFNLLQSRVRNASEETVLEILADSFEVVKFISYLSKINRLESSDFGISYIATRFWRLYRLYNDKTVLWTLHQVIGLLQKCGVRSSVTLKAIITVINLELGNMEIESNDYSFGAAILKNGDCVTAINQSFDFFKNQNILIDRLKERYIDYLGNRLPLAASTTMTQLRKLSNCIRAAAESVRYSFLIFFVNSDVVASETGCTFPEGFPKELPHDARMFPPELSVGDKLLTDLVKCETYCQTLSEVIAVQSMMDLHFQVARMANLPGYQELVAQTVKLIDKHLAVLGTTDTNPIQDHVLFYSRGHLFGNPVSLITKDIIRFLGDLAVIVAPDNFTTPESLLGKLPCLDPLRKSLIRLDTYTEKLGELGVDGSDVVVEGLSTALMQLRYCIYLVFFIYRNVYIHLDASPTQMRNKKALKPIFTWFRLLVTEIAVSNDFSLYTAAETGERALMIRAKIASASASDRIPIGIINAVQNSLTSMYDLLTPRPHTALKLVGLIDN